MESEKLRRARKGRDPYPSHLHERKRRLAKSRQAAAEWPPAGEAYDRAGRPLAQPETTPEPEPAPVKARGRKR